MAGLERVILLLFALPICRSNTLTDYSRSEEAIKSADKLFGTPTNGFDAVSYVGQIEISIEADRLNPESSNWRDLCHGPNLRRLLIAIGIQCFLQAQGSSYIINYMVRFLNDTGITNVFPCIMGLNCTYYAGILTGHFLPDRYGRRPVLIWSVTWCGLFMLLIASVATAVSPSTSQSSAAALAILFLWQLASGVMSPLVWIVCTEAAPTRNREKVLSVALFVSFGVSLLIASVSPYIQDPGFGNMGSRIVSLMRILTNVICSYTYSNSRDLSGGLSLSSPPSGRTSWSRKQKAGHSNSSTIYTTIKCRLGSLENTNLQTRWVARLLVMRKWMEGLWWR